MKSASVSGLLVDELTPVSEVPFRTNDILSTSSAGGTPTGIPTGTPTGTTISSQMQHEHSNTSENSSNGSSGELRSAAIAIWRMCLEAIRSQVSAQSFRTWFEPLSAIELEGSLLTLKAPSNFFYEWIMEHHQSVLEASLKEVLGPSASFRFDSANEIEGLNTSLIPQNVPQNGAQDQSAQLNGAQQNSGQQNGGQQHGQQYESNNGQQNAQQSNGQQFNRPQQNVFQHQQPAPQAFTPQNGVNGMGQQMQQQQQQSAPQQTMQQHMQNNAMQHAQQGNMQHNNIQQGGMQQGGLQQGFQQGQQQNGYSNQLIGRPQTNPVQPQRVFPPVMPQQGAATNFQIGGKKPPIENNLNPRYTFDTFIRGESNKLAYAAAMAVANNPGGTSYNPLVLYGNVGLGKTHLIQGVGNLVLQKFAGARVLYTSSDRFTVEFVDAIQNDRINEFTNLYRSIDVLIIDDVQFFAGKEKTQDIFFHTFNALRELGKQIILTCDRPPKELKDIDDRLLNRLQWGLTADIQAPDLETRIAILRHKALNDGIDLHSDVIEFIATNVTTNIRELEGCLISLLATASLENKEPNVELAREVLRKVAKRSAPVLSIEQIQRTVAKRFNIDEELMRAKTRKQEIVQARQVAMFLCKELTNNSLKTIGLHFGGRDHSTVIHACQTVTDDKRHNPTLSGKVEELRKQFELMQ